MIQPVKVHPPKTDKISDVINDIEKQVILPKNLNTFASIITGGRSPQHDTTHQTQDLPKETTETDILIPTVQTETEINTKLFKRKRRIEFMAIRPSESSTILNIDTNSTSSIHGDDTSEVKEIDISDVRIQMQYQQFVKSSSDECVILDEKDIDTEIISLENDELNSTKKEEINSLKSIIEAKLKFLCDGRPEVSAVQAIMIQLEVSNFICLLFSLINLPIIIQSLSKISNMS